MSKTHRLARARDLQEQGHINPEVPQRQEKQSPQEDYGHVAHLYWNLRQVMDSLANRTDGWLRIIPSPDSHELHLKWKFTSGKFEQCYVFVTVDSSRMADGLALISHKIAQAEMGALKPTKDRLFQDT